MLASILSLLQASKTIRDGVWPSIFKELGVLSCWLPLELIELVLLHLEAEEILRCQLISQTLHDLITRSARLQYKIELFVARARDGLVVNPGAQERLTRLRQWRSLWHEGNFTLKRVLERKPPKNPISGLLMDEITEDRHGFSTYAFPSPFRELPEQRWTITGLKFSVVDFFVNGSYGLFAVLEDVPDHNIIRAHLLAYDGTNHPHAASPVLEMHAPVPLVNIYCNSTANSFAVFADADDDSFSFFWIWDWRTGRLLAHADCIAEFVSESIDLLDDNLLLIAGPCSEAANGFILLLDYRAAGGFLRSFACWHRIVEDATTILELPRLKPGCSWHRFTIFNFPVIPPEDLSVRNRGAIFHSDDHSGIVWIRMSTFEEERWAQHGIAIPVKSILSRAGGAYGSDPDPVTYSWPEWARETRYFTADDLPDWQVIARLSRFMCTRQRPKEDGTGEEKVVVYHEFDSIQSIRRDLASGYAKKIATIVTKPTTPDPSFFESTEETCLPYREVVTNVVVPEGYSAVLEVDHILLNSQDMSRILFYSL